MSSNSFNVQTALLLEQISNTMILRELSISDYNSQVTSIHTFNLKLYTRNLIRILLLNIQQEHFSTSKYNPSLHNPRSISDLSLTSLKRKRKRESSTSLNESSSSLTPVILPSQSIDNNKLLI